LKNPTGTGATRFNAELPAAEPKKPVLCGDLDVNQSFAILSLFQFKARRATGSFSNTVNDPNRCRTDRPNRYPDNLNQPAHEAVNGLNRTAIERLSQK